MAKKQKRYGFRVVVEPRRPGDFGFAHIGGMTQSEREWESACKAIAEQIRHHVDGLPSEHGRGVSIEWETSSVCEYCGSDWTEESTEYNGGCCAKDEPPPSEEIPGCVWAGAETPFAENH